MDPPYGSVIYTIRILESRIVGSMFSASPRALGVGMYQGTNTGVYKRQGTSYGPKILGSFNEGPRKPY